MDLSQHEAGAIGTPPTAPVTPSTGYPTNGDPQSAVDATTPGAYHFYQMQEEIRNLLANAGITPDHETLTQLWDAISAIGPELSFGGMEYPTIDTSDNKLSITPVAAAAGGYVSIPAGVEVTLGQEVTAGKTGRMRRAVTAAWDSADLDASSTYYLRATLDSNGVLAPYVQKGTDGDAIPAGLKGTPGGGSGGGFDSTVIDMLICKIVTGAATTVPVVTTLANAALLFARSLVSGTPTDLGADTYEYAPAAITLNWARSPRAVDMYGVVNHVGVAQVHGGANYARSLTWSRYSVTAKIRTDFDAAPLTPTGTIEIQPIA